MCNRLGLKSLAYLWARDQPTLLQEMIDAGMHCVIIKVACYKLSAKHLNHSLQELQPYFLQLQKEFEMNVCGEGGEYESLTLDCPLFKRRLRIDDYEVIYHDKNEMAPVVYMKINKISLVEK